MLAPELLPQRPLPPPRTPPRHVERARHATRRRARRARRRLNRPVFVVVSLAVIAMVMMLAYVALTAMVTSQSYRVAQAQRERAALVSDTLQNDEAIAQLQSPERLAALAAKLRMHDPHVYAVVRLPDPKPRPRPTGLAFFGGWLSAAEH